MPAIVEFNDIAKTAKFTE
jgi:hypothetical protein